VVKVSKTPVLKADQARALLDSIETDSIVGLRDLAIQSVMAYSFPASRARCGEMAPLI
jgi:hypothetical protein